MSKKVEEIINVAKNLSLEERAELAGSLLLSLDEPSESEVERMWLQEAERRRKKRVAPEQPVGCRYTFTSTKTKGRNAPCQEYPMSG